MAIFNFHLIIASVVALALAHFAFAADDTPPYLCNCTKPIKRSSFPPDFVFGTASSAYQNEGAWNLDGKGPNIWDTFTHLYPEKIYDRSNGDVAVDAYGRYEEDVNLIKDLGVDTYRLSISWSRILPRGLLSGGVNQAGIDYYRNVFIALKDKGIEPCVTIFHWDVPQALEDLYGGFLSYRIVEDFRNFADLLFRTFGEWVKTWITVNEAWTFSNYGYASGMLAPGRCTIWGNLNCTGGDSATEPYIVAHHLLLAHAAAVDVYRRYYQQEQQGMIGITVVTRWFLPYRAGNPDDELAAQTQLDFTLGWIMDPVTFGRYPESMQQRVGDRLPQFTKAEAEKLAHSYDFLGLNYYTGTFTHFFDPDYKPPFTSYTTDSGVNLTAVDSDGNHCGRGPAGASWLQMYPIGMKSLLNYTKTVYDNPTIFITENGVCTNDTLSIEETMNDQIRIEYLEDHLCCVLDAIETSNVTMHGYILWALMDNFEWNAGFFDRFGVYHVDFDHNLERSAKESAVWYKNFLAGNPAPAPPRIPSLIREFPAINNRKILPA